MGQRRLAAMSGALAASLTLALLARQARRSPARAAPE
jgi:hypothetical protein